MQFSAASAFLTVATNIFVTSLISFRLVRARRNLQKSLPGRDMQVYTGDIVVLVESAAPLAVFGLVVAIIQTVGDRAIEAPGYFVWSSLFQALFYSFCVRAFLDFHLIDHLVLTLAPTRRCLRI